MEMRGVPLPTDRWNDDITNQCVSPNLPTTTTTTGTDPSPARWNRHCILPATCRWVPGTGLPPPAGEMPGTDYLPPPGGGSGGVGRRGEAPHTCHLHPTTIPATTCHRLPACRWEESLPAGEHLPPPHPHRFGVETGGGVMVVGEVKGREERNGRGDGLSSQTDSPNPSLPILLLILPFPTIHLMESNHCHPLSQ